MYPNIRLFIIVYENCIRFIRSTRMNTMFRKLKDRIHTLVKRKQRAIVVALILVLLSFASGAFAVIYWQDSVTVNIHVTGISAALLNPDIDSYRNKVEATTLTNNKVILTIYSENYQNVIMDLTASNVPTNLGISAQGQYIHAYDHPGIGWSIDLLGSPFNVMGTNIPIDKTQMMYGGYGMMVTFTFNQEAVAAGDYVVSLNFGLGFSS